MTSLTGVSQPSPQAEPRGGVGPRLIGAWQVVAIAAWGFLFVVCLISFTMSVINLYTWDRTPAAELLGFFPNLDIQSIEGRYDFQAAVQGMGFSLPAFAFLLTAFRLIGGLPLFALSALMIWRNPNRLMAVLFAMLLAVMGAAGVWNNTMFGWATARADWMSIPTQILNLLLWYGLIFLYSFPNGRFMPRWTVILPLLLIPLVISAVFDLNFFTNPNTWPGVLTFLPNIVFIGVALFSVIFRYQRTTDPEQKRALKWYVYGVVMMITLYFILFFLVDVNGMVSGRPLWPDTRSLVLFILITEPLWFTASLLFALATARAVFRDRLLG